MVSEKDKWRNKLALSIGSNLGDKREYLKKAKGAIEKEIGKIESCSKTYLTEAWGKTTLHPFLNEVVLVTTSKTAQEILSICLSIEKRLGRNRLSNHYENRTIDIDLLFFEDKILNTKKLSLPHPRMHLRNFVLYPLVDIAPDWVHPIFKEDTISLLKRCDDTNKLKVQP